MGQAVVLDAQPVVAYLADEPSAGEVADLLRRGAYMSVVNAAEVVDVLIRGRRMTADDAEAIVGGLLEDVIAPVQVSRELALRAGAIRGRSYHRRDCEVSLADCFAIATAGPGGTVVTSDAALARAARKEGVEVVALPDGTGRRP